MGIGNTLCEIGYLEVSRLLRTSRVTSPERIFLKTVMASAWDIPSRVCLFTDTISSPGTRGYKSFLVKREHNETKSPVQLCNLLLA